MKTTKFFILGISVLMLSSCATEFEIINDDVPSSVSTAFKAKYADVNDLEWEVEKSDGRLIYEAAFKVGGKRKEAEFKPDGTFIREE